MQTIVIITSKLVCLCLCYLLSLKEFLSFSKFTFVCLHTSLLAFHFILRLIMVTLPRAHFNPQILD